MRSSSVLFAIVLGASTDAAGEETHRLQLDLGFTGSFGGVIHGPPKPIPTPGSFGVVPYTWQRWSVSPSAPWFSGAGRIA